MDLHYELISLVFQVLILFAAPSIGCESINLNTFILPVFKDKSVSDILLSTNSGTRHWWMCTLRCRSDTRCISYQFNNLTNTCSLFGCGFSDPDKTLLPITEETGWQLYGIVGRDHSFGHACTTSGDCDYANSFCRDERCECDLGYFYHPNTGGCVTRDQSFGHACTTSGDCYYANSFCRDWRCECGLGYSYDPNTGSCVTYCDVYGNVFQVQREVGIWDHNQVVYTDITYTECLKACIDASNYICRSIEIDPKNWCTLSDTTWFSASSDALDTTESSGWLFLTRHCAVTTGH